MSSTGIATGGMMSLDSLATGGLVDEGGAVVVDEGVVADQNAAGSGTQLPAGSPRSNSNLAYCMVALPDKDPIVIRPSN